MPSPLGLLAVGALLIGALLLKKKPLPAAPTVLPTTVLPTLPAIPPIPVPPGMPPIPVPPGMPIPGWPSVPPSGAPPQSAAGCELDANLPTSMIPLVNRLLTDPSVNAGELKLGAAAARQFGYVKTAACLDARAAQLGQTQTAPAPGAPGGWPADPPAWYPSVLPWPPPFPYPSGPSTPPSGPTPSPGPPPSWWPPGVPWPPLPGLVIPTPEEPGGEIPPPGDVPEPLFYPDPPVGLKPNPEQNPIVNVTNLETAIRVGDTFAGYAAYYSQIPFQSGTLAETFDILRGINPGLSASTFTVGRPIYILVNWVQARGLPPRPTSVYQAAGGFVP